VSRLSVSAKTVSAKKRGGALYAPLLSEILPTLPTMSNIHSDSKNVHERDIATMATDSAPISTSASTCRKDWHELAARVLAGQQITETEGEEILASPDEQILDLMAAAYEIRHHHFGNTVQLYFLMNAKSGLCKEDCGYCSQSKDSAAEIPKYSLLNREQLLDGAREAFERQSKTYCIVISGRSPTERELNALTVLIPEIKQQYDLKICACLGLLNAEQAERLKACGVDRVNHNVNTSEDHYDEICSTHSYQDRIDTLQVVRAAGMEMCSGGIIGMGEQQIDVVRMALELRDLGVHSIPVNFLNPIEGTALAGTWDLNPRYCLKVLALYRFANPDREIRVAGGRELHLGQLQPLGLYAANSLFVGDYLTTKGQPPTQDYEMIEQLGFEITRHNEAAAADA